MCEDHVKVCDEIWFVINNADRRELFNYIYKLKEQLERVEKSNKDAIEFIKEKEYVIDLNTFGYELNNYEIYKLLRILDTDKGDMKDE